MNVRCLIDIWDVKKGRRAFPLGKAMNLHEGVPCFVRYQLNPSVSRSLQVSKTGIYGEESGPLLMGSSPWDGRVNLRFRKGGDLPIKGEEFKRKC